MDNEILIERAKAFMRAVASHAPIAEIEAYYAPDALQEFPNRLLPQRAVRDRSALREASAKGRQVIAAQTIEVVNAVASGQCGVLEAIWTGTLAVGFGMLRPGDELRALRPVFEFKDGLIWRQRDYDCFYPWARPSRRRRAPAAHRDRAASGPAPGRPGRR